MLPEGHAARFGIAAALEALRERAAAGNKLNVQLGDITGRIIEYDVLARAIPCTAWPRPSLPGRSAARARRISPIPSRAVPAGVERRSEAARQRSPVFPGQRKHAGHLAIRRRARPVRRGGRTVRLTRPPGSSRRRAGDEAGNDEQERPYPPRPDGNQIPGTIPRTRDN